MDATLILYGLIAAGLVLWLRSILGTRHGDERERSNPFTTLPVEKDTETLGRESSARNLPDNVVGLALPDLMTSLPKKLTISSKSAEIFLAELSRMDRDFDLARFTQGAQDAFAIIVEAFASGDKTTLKELLEPQVFLAFDTAITSREARGETVSTEIHAVRKMDILDARMDGKNFFITMRFIADETCVVKNKDGVVFSGDSNRITEMNDIWVFSRSIKSRNPAWLLHETRDGDVVEESKTPVPDSNS